MHTLLTLITIYLIKINVLKFILITLKFIFYFVSILFLYIIFVLLL